MKLFILLLVLFVAADSLYATTDTNETENIDEETPLIVGRDPFWPVGYTPPPKIVPVADVQPADTDDTPPQPPPEIKPKETEWPEIHKRLRVRGITSTLDGGYIAMVDGFGLVEKGQIIQITERNTIFRWDVDNITQRGLSTRRLDARPAR